MDFKKFNESISNLIINSESNFGFVTNEVANPFHKDMKLIAEKLKQTIDDCLKICLEQNIIASDNVKFGEYLSEMSKQMWIHILADQKKPTHAEAHVAVETLMKQMDIDQMRLALATDEALKTGEKLEEVRVKYDSYSIGIIQDAYKTMQIKKFLGE